MARYRIIVDRDMCIGCGIAPSTCSEVFELGEDNGKNRVIEKYAEKTSVNSSVGTVPEELLRCVKQAADSCPVQAITVEETR